MDGTDLVVAVRVTPRARHNTISGVAQDVLQIRTTAPPADGKANQAATKLLAEFLGVPASRISLLRGRAHRNKQFRIRGPF